MLNIWPYDECVFITVLGCVSKAIKTKGGKELQKQLDGQSKHSGMLTYTIQ
jgi:hypothetical protein